MSSPYKDAFYRVRHAICPDETRSNLTTVHVEVVDGFSALVTTDGHRLAYCRVADMPANGDKTRTLLRPKKDKFSSEESAREYLHGPDAGYRFPAWRAVSPSKPSATITVERKPLIAAIREIEDANANEEEWRNSATNLAIAYARRAEGEAEVALWNAIHAEDHETVIVTLRARYERKRSETSIAKKDKPRDALALFSAVTVTLHKGLTVSTAFAQSKRSKATHFADTYAKGSKVSASVNTSYLIEALESFKADTLTLEATDAFTAIVLRNGEQDFELIMPMKV